MQERFREKYRVLGLKIEANNGKKIKGISLETLFTISEVLDVPVEKFFAED